MPQKQHYIPQFYQRQWADEDGRLCEHTRRGNAVRARMCFPAGTGYQPGIYTIPEVAEPIANHTENVFLSRVDTGAAQALRGMIGPDQPYVWTSPIKSEWIRFVMSLMHRTPERVDYMKAKIAKEYPRLLEEFRDRYPTMRGPNDPETLEEYQAKMAPNPVGRANAVLLQMMINSQRVGELLGAMQWHVIGIDKSPEPFLTSDRPIIMTNGLLGPTDHLALPISPRHLFLAVNDDQVLRVLQSRDPLEVLRHINDRVVSQARKYVYGRDASQLAFVEDRLGSQSPSTPLETARR